MDSFRWFIYFLIKETSGRGIKNKNISNREFDEELSKPIIKKFKLRNMHLPIIENVWGADLTNMQLISKFDKG